MKNNPKATVLGILLICILFFHVTLNGQSARNIKSVQLIDAAYVAPAPGALLPIGVESPLKMVQLYW